MKVIILDDQVLFREGLASLLNSQPDFEVVGEAEITESSTEKAILLKPDLVLFDPVQPSGNGLNALQKIASSCPGTNVVVLTNEESDDLLFETLRAGASGYLLKNTPISKLLETLRAIDRGEPALAHSMTVRILDEFKRMSNYPSSPPDGFERLTDREIEIMRFLAKGASNSEISSRLYISKNTVKVHVHNILDKTGMANRREAGLLARSLRLSRS